MFLLLQLFTLINFSLKKIDHQIRKLVAVHSGGQSKMKDLVLLFYKKKFFLGADFQTLHGTPDRKSVSAVVLFDCISEL